MHSKEIGPAPGLQHTTIYGLDRNDGYPAEVFNISLIFFHHKNMLSSSHAIRAAELRAVGSAHLRTVVERERARGCKSCGCSSGECFQKLRGNLTSAHTATVEAVHNFTSAAAGATQELTLLDHANALY